MEKKLLLATTNQHKASEIAAIFAEAGVTGWGLLTLNDFPGYQPPVEDGSDFTLNAAIKARAAAKMSSLICLADDSGLTVAALDGAPGIYSARYAGEEQDEAANRAKLLRQMAGIPTEDRAAAFVCVAALAVPRAGGVPMFSFTEGRLAGMIAMEERGEQGFGYDSLFYLPEYDCTVAELQSEEKNRLSHRGKAMSLIAQALLEVRC